MNSVPKLVSADKAQVSKNTTTAITHIKCYCGNRFKISGTGEKRVCRQCNRLWVKIGNEGWKTTDDFEEPFKRKENKFKAQEKEVVATIHCSCGNNIEVRNPKDTTRKCFGCNTFYDKENNVWVKKETIPRTTMTIGNVIEQLQHNKDRIQIGQITIKPARHKIGGGK